MWCMYCLTALLQHTRLCTLTSYTTLKQFGYSTVLFTSGPLCYVCLYVLYIACLWAPLLVEWNLHSMARCCANADVC